MTTHPIKMKVPSGTFAFERNNDGEGFWVCLLGKDPTSIGNMTTANQIVSVDFGKELTETAISIGLADKADLVSRIERPKYKPVSISKEPKEKNGKIRFLINPFDLKKTTE